MIITFSNHHTKISNDLDEKKIRKKSFIHNSIFKKYSGITLSKDVKDLYNKTL